MNKETNTIEQALTMYKETVSPSTERLSAILSQIPEQKTLEGRRAIRSPYTWFVVSQFVSLSLLLIVVYPTYNDLAANDPDFYFRTTDTEVAAFEQQIMLEDYNDALGDQINSSLLK